MQSHLELKPISSTFGVTVGATVSALPGLPPGAKKIIFQSETKSMRARFDSTATVTSGAGGGLYYSSLTQHTLEGYDLLNSMRLVSDDGDDGTINVIYLGEEQPGTTS